MATKKVVARKKSPVKKPVAKTAIASKASKKQGWLKSFLSFVGHHRLVAFLLVLLLLWVGGLAYEKYKDWDNAQMIKGLARDFPALVEEIEATTGLDLEVKNSCMTTTEKFSDGVRICEISVAKKTEKNSVNHAIETVRKSTVFMATRLVENERGYEVLYRNKKSCQLSNMETVYVSCVTGVRDANVDLAKEVFGGIPK